MNFRLSGNRSDNIWEAIRKTYYTNTMFLNKYKLPRIDWLVGTHKWVLWVYSIIFSDVKIWNFIFWYFFWITREVNRLTVTHHGSQNEMIHQSRSTTLDLLKCTNKILRNSALSCTVYVYDIIIFFSYICVCVLYKPWNLRFRSYLRKLRCGGVGGRGVHGTRILHFRVFPHHTRAVHLDNNAANSTLVLYIYVCI